MPQEQIANLVVAEEVPHLLVRQHELGEGGGEVLECSGGGQVGHRRQVALTQRQSLLGQALEALGGIAELVEAVVEGPMLAAMHGLLADEAGDLALQLGVGDLVSVVPH